MKNMNRRECEIKAIADAAYAAWRSGKNYDLAWNRAEEAIRHYEPYSCYEAEEIALKEALKKLKE